METKICTKCGDVFPATPEYFARHKLGKYGIRSNCKDCEREYQKTRCENNKGYEYYYQNNGEQLKTCNKCQEQLPASTEYFNRANKNKDGLNTICKKCCGEYLKKYYIDNKDVINTINNSYYSENKEAAKERARIWNSENRERRNQIRRDWNHKNPEYVKKNVSKWKRVKRKTDPAYKINSNISCAISCSLKGNKSGWHWEDLVGYTLKELMIHLERRFKTEMSWDNYGEWHIDHIRPQASFNFTTSKDSEFRECWALDNLQPLWAEDNMKKSNKW